MARLKRTQAWFWSTRLAAFDFMSLVCCGVISSVLRDYPVPFLNFTWFDGLLVMLTCGTCLTIIGGYEAKRDMSTLRYVSEHVLAMGAVLLIAFIVTYSFSTYNNAIKPGRSMLLLGLTLFTPLSLTYRYYLSRAASREAAKRFFYVIGNRYLGAKLELICQKSRFRHPLRFIEINPEQHEIEGSLQGKTSDEIHPLRMFLTEEMSQCEGVVFDVSHGKLSPDLEKLLLDINLHSVPVYPVESFIETYFYKIDISHVSIAWALDGTFKADHHSAYGKFKTLIDTLFGGILFILLLPVMLLTALAIKLTDTGPALFSQVRVGRFDRPFVLYKFRTMTVNREANDNPYTQEKDSRVTKIGRILRRTRLDELPQLWNVLRGDMSLIGPRAEWNRLVEQYRKEIPFYHLRYMVKPGITGWAQVNYGYGADLSDAFEKLQYDLYYIKHCSLQLDASIILKTLFTVLSASGR